MTDIVTLLVDNQPIEVAFYDDNTLEAQEKALQALAAKQGAEAALTATELARDQAADLVLPENIFVDVSQATAEAAVSTGTTFKLVDSLTGIVDVRKRTVGGSDLLYRELTKSSLNAGAGSSQIGHNSGGYVSDLLQYVTPEQYGAVGDAAGYYLGLPATDCTEAFELALATGKEVRGNGTYLVSGTTITNARQKFSGPGKLVKMRGITDQVIRVNANGVTIEGWAIDGFNASFTGSISGTTLTIASALVGTITIDTVNVRGPMLDATGLTPGTRILEQLTGTPGGVGTYRISRAHSLSSRQFRFTDAPAFFQANDLIYTEHDDLTVRNIVLDGSAGGGVGCIGGARLRLSQFTIRCVYDNGVIVACSGSERTGADNASITDGIVDGTGIQNGYFITADAGSGSTSEFIDGVTISNVVGRNCGDTGLEIGIHVRNAKVSKATLGPSKAPPLLCRDAISWSCDDITIIPPAGSDQTSEWSAIAVVKQTEPSTWRCNGIFRNIKFTGLAKRAFAYINQSYVTIEACRDIDGASSAADGSDLTGQLIALGDAVSNISIRGNSARGWERAVMANFGAAPVAISDLLVEGNEFQEIGTGLDLFNVTASRIKSVGNTYRAVRDRVYNTSSATLTPTGGVPALTTDDIKILPGFTGANPTNFNPTSAPSNGVATYRDTLALQLPEVAFASVSLGVLADLGDCVLQLAVPGLAQIATFEVSALLGTVTKLRGTSQFLDATGASGFSDWALFPSSGFLIFQRRGANTGSSGRWLFVSKVTA